jgi:hypothetical protein
MPSPSGRYFDLPLWVETSREVETGTVPPLSPPGVEKVSTSLYPCRYLESLLYYLLSIYPGSLYFFSVTKVRISSFLRNIVFIAREGNMASAVL